ncbi:MAG: hypothetical protein WD342_07495 [Verrucomicrobiales bacterium]
MILVELAGASGVGKSTVAPLLAQALRRALGDHAVAAMPEKDQPRRRRRWTRMQRRFWLASHPRSFLAAWRGSRTRPQIGSFAAWKHAFSSMGIGRRALAKGVKVALVDQGMLRLRMDAGHVPVLPRPLLPDLVLHLVAEPGVLELRRIYRGKPKFVLLEGTDRMARARDVRDRLTALPEAELRAALTRFGTKFCSPALSEQDIEGLLGGPPDESAMTGAEGNARQRSRCAPEVCELFRQRGVVWRQVDNTEADALDRVVNECMAAILALLSPSEAP